MSSQTNNAKAALVMVGAMAAFTINDSIMKGVLAHLPLFQAIFLRGLVNVVMVFAVVLPLMGRVKFDLSRRDWALVIGRSICETGGAFTFLYAVANMRFANAVAIEQMAPLTIALAGFLVFRDPLGWRRTIAVAFGFVGALLIIKPGTGAFSIYSLWALSAVVFITLRDACVRAMSPNVPTATVTLFAVLFVTAGAGVASLSADWVPVTWPVAGLIFAAAALLIVGYALSVVVVRMADMTFTAPYRYTSLVWALVLGFVFFGEWPDIWSLVGAAIIAATGLFTILREAQLARRRGRADRALRPQDRVISPRG
ncbi:DMT family transporter [Celeribacter sp.]|uniref:DMT family transporter n=1 Tax=Celeribacter sp. TaxID=1890673 RepID=UPI003A957EF5